MIEAEVKVPNLSKTDPWDNQSILRLTAGAVGADQLTDCFPKNRQDGKEKILVVGKLVSNAVSMLTRLVDILQEDFTSFVKLFKHEADEERTQGIVFRDAAG